MDPNICIVWIWMIQFSTFIYSVNEALSKSVINPS